MAKKTQKAKPAKKAAKSAKPVKKAVVKKPAKKAAPKKVVKKAIAKKVVKKALPKKAANKTKAPAKKAVAKKVIKKAEKPVKKVTTKKPVSKKPAPKKSIQKPLVKNMAKPVKKAVEKKVEKTAKKVTKPVKEEKSKTIAKPSVKPEPKKEMEKPIAAVKTEASKKPETVKKKQRDYDLDDDGSSRDEAPMIVEYKTPSIRKPMGPAPKPHINTDTRTRYSDAELKEFKELILKKLAEAQKDFELLKSTLSHKDDHGTDDTSPTFKLLEDGSDVLSKEETAHLASRQEKFIQNLQNALIRIENKTYGICRATGKLISKERLRSVPHATLAIEAKLEQNV
jgi:RNA polymerase-binding transcription factor DksA